MGAHISKRFWNFDFPIFSNFLKENFNVTIVPYEETKNLNYLVKKRSYSETECNLRLAGRNRICMGYLWICSVQGHFGVIWCTYNFSEKNYFQNTAFLQITSKK